MANYTTADIKALRERTGAGMLDVKKALDEADGDTDKALEIIRVKGLRGVAKREGRATADGVVAVDIRAGEGGEVGTMIEVNSETDFVAKNEEFTTFADQVLAQAVATGETDVEALLNTKTEDGQLLSELVTEIAARLGERIVVRRVARVTGEKVTSYLHKTNPDLPPQIGVLVATDAAGSEVARDVGTHIAALAPKYLARDEVAEDIVADERRIAEETARNEGRPEQAMPKIIEGRLTGFFKENVLVDQAYAKDAKKSVGKVFEEVGGKVTAFERFRVGA